MLNETLCIKTPYIFYIKWFLEVGNVKCIVDDILEMNIEIGKKVKVTSLVYNYFESERYLTL